ncbi:hypothetical protein AB0J72_08740 [Dactylosporangium sp. NPDC049742]|uniref:hypothetical protein n=1 Tax=Dactylosporangium sp. NPDC049742 TaxID=3154737 RepID=UPI003444E5EA
MSVMHLPAVVQIPVLGRFDGPPQFQGGGQSEGVWRIPARPGLLFKRYTWDAAAALDIAAMDRLIAQPAALPDAADRALVAQATAWPVSRVTDGDRTVGVVMPEAPDDLLVSWKSTNSKTASIRRERLPIDWLAKPNDYLVKRGVPEQSAPDRTRFCVMLAQLAGLFERCGIVYADWSYANAFWHPTKRTVYLIDIDGSSYGPRPHVNTANFEDPLTPMPQPVDTYVDRYRVALLIARVLTGTREPPDVTAALAGLGGDVPDTLLQMLTAPTRQGRPSLRQLLQAFGMVDPSGVIDWRPRQRTGPPTRTGVPVTPTQTVRPGPPSRPGPPTLTTGPVTATGRAAVTGSIRPMPTQPRRTPAGTQGTRATPSIVPGPAARNPARTPPPRRPPPRVGSARTTRSSSAGSNPVLGFIAIAILIAIAVALFCGGYALLSSF